MVHVIYILVIFFILALYVRSLIAAKRKRELDEIIYDGLHADYYALTQDYKALDQGMSEVQDAYATDSLQYEATVSELTAKVEAYREVSVEKEIELRNVRVSQYFLNEENARLLSENLDMQKAIHLLADNPLG